MPSFKENGAINPPLVELTSKGGVKKLFRITHAESILKLKFSEWKLTDSDFTFNGIEIVKKPTEKKETKKDV